MTMALVKLVTRVLRSIKRLIFFVNDFKEEDERGKNRSYRGVRNVYFVEY